MEDLGDFLYIIVAIIGIVYSIAKKNNKKAQETPPPIIAEEDDFWDEEPLIIQKEETETPVFQKEVPVSKYSERPKDFFVREPAKQREPDKAMIEKKKQMANSYTRVKNTPTKQKVQEVELQEQADLEASTMDFDLKQAVIYSEILKRPEF
ncbi:hypothetical protein [Saccharicrinis fermentans]|uniref:Uncharacterized protein n=1 Tax=Saccharicrinis fermentans DSM 9555 = JCM 21142 TaxID=869213 RepID=W7Y325_9BACT|nr:hypothetical protein [Saccharicrinis fermentans]GAF02402.1 hypothetical protein JCM21142_31036 [Saccharicrinis fermentans DSM 9555 = JCM 21142]